MLCLIVVEVPVFTTLRSWLCLIKDSLVAYRQKCGVPEDPLPPERLVEQKSGIWHWNLEVEKILWLIPLGKVVSYLIIPPVTWGFYYHPLVPGRFFISRHKELCENAGVLLSPVSQFSSSWILQAFGVDIISLSFHLAALVFVHLSFNLITIATWYLFLMLQDASKKLSFLLRSNCWFLQPESWKRKFWMLGFEMFFQENKKVV